jgi:hypothetical protein
VRIGIMDLYVTYPLAFRLNSEIEDSSS